MNSTTASYVIVLLLGVAIGLGIEELMLQPAREAEVAAAPAVQLAPPVVGQDANGVRQPVQPAVPEQASGPAENQVADHPPASEEAASPKLLVSEPKFDFGEVDRGSTVEHTFVLTNEGKAPLVIGKVVATDHHTLTKLSAREIAPGQQAELSATLGLSGQHGSQNRRLIVESNDPATPKFTLSLVGSVAGRVKVDPARVDLGQVSDLTPASITFTVTGQRGLTFNIVDTRTSGASVSAEVKVVTPGKEFEVTATVKPPLPAGGFHGWIHLITDQRGEYHVIGVPVIAHVTRADGT